MNHASQPNKRPVGTEDYMAQAYSVARHDLLHIGIDTMSSIPDEASKFALLACLMLPH